MMETERSWGLLVREYGICVGCMLAACALLVVTIVFSRNSQRASLKADVVAVLEEKVPDVWEVGEYVPLDSPIELSASCFAASTAAESGYVLIMRIETLYGPFPAVFTYTEREGTQFVGIATLHGRIATLMENGSQSKQLQYWKARVPLLIANIQEKRR
ncbi:MAG: hypothetical protein IJR50_01290 [Treponema sp.]|nr:hypothetical protein [Treponema sp.]